jgi:hypothetical protein
MTGRGDAGSGDAGRRWPALAWALWALVAAGLVVALGFDQALRRIGRPDLVSIGGDAVPYLPAMASAATVGRCWPAAGPATRSAGCCWPSRCR